MPSSEPYNPLDLRHLGEGVARALLAHVPEPLPPADKFLGSGIYAIYYAGDFAPYEPIALRNRENRYEIPIYVGKGVPAGRRTGGGGFAAATGFDLYSRLVHHFRSIDASTNLDGKDFACRYLVVAPVWIPLAEDVLIRWFAPLWNTLVTGFGNNDPGKRRYSQQRSLWDVLHPGREWAARCANNPRTQQEIVSLVGEALIRPDNADQSVSASG